MVMSSCRSGMERSTGRTHFPGKTRSKDQKANCDVDIYTIIFLALAVFIFLRLRSVLGQRTGHERPPFERSPRNVAPGAPDTNVVPMPGSVIDQAPAAPNADVAPSD